MKTEKMHKRKKRFAKAKFQQKFIITFCVLVIIGSLLAGLLIYAMTKSTFTTAFVNSRLEMKNTADFILPAVIMSGIIVVICVGIGTVILTLYTSNRIAGPLKRMEGEIKDVAGGNLRKRFSVRELDEIKSLSEELDEMALKLKSNIQDIKDAVSELEKSRTDKEFSENIAKLKAVLSQFLT
ncbi:MAG: HAMP domain-containing protein [bacterium]|nr:HAMP domain-containing protein [bacterium]